MIVFVEIRLLIAGYVLTVSPSESIVPNVVACNQAFPYYQEPNFNIRRGNAHCGVSGTPITIQTPMADKIGEYTQLRNLNFKVIDASYLRTCKKIYNEGIDLLYGRNNFAFDMMSESKLRSCPSYSKQEGQYRPDPHRPLGSSYNNAIARAMPQIAKKARIKQLPGWLYYDYFLRFLWTITPINAASLTALSFVGQVKFHKCQNTNVCNNFCDTDLVESLHFYIPFLNKFCTGLKHLTIQAKPDCVTRVNSVMPHDPPKDRDEALLPLLEGSIRSILSLEKLEVVDEHMVPISIADPTIEWLKDRARATEGQRRGEIGL